MTPKTGVGGDTGAWPMLILEGQEGQTGTENEKTSKMWQIMEESDHYHFILHQNIALLIFLTYS